MLIDPVPAAPPGNGIWDRNACSLSAQFFSRMNPKRLGGAEVRLYQVAVGDGGDLRAGVEVLGKSGNTGVGVRRNGRIVLVEVLQAERVFFGGVVVDVGHGQVGFKPRRPGNEGVIEMGDRWEERRRVHRWGSATCRVRREARVN